MRVAPHYTTLARDLAISRSSHGRMLRERDSSLSDFPEQDPAYPRYTLRAIKPRDCRDCRSLYLHVVARGKERIPRARYSRRRHDDDDDDGGG